MTAQKKGPRLSGNSCEPNHQHFTFNSQEFITMSKTYPYFNATMAKPFRWTYQGKPLVA